MEAKTLFDLWKQKELKILASKKRRYPHFDSRINFEKNEISLKSAMLNPSNIEKHSFYPFIKSDLSSPRYKKSDDGKRKIENKIRPIAYAAHYDSLIYSWYSTLLTVEYERKIRHELNIYENVLAYLEKDKSNINFSYDAFEFIKTKNKCVALAFDISSFFDGLDHEHLEKMWSSLIEPYNKLPKDHLRVFLSITNYTFVKKERLESEFPEFFERLSQNSNARRKGKKVLHGTTRICSPEEFRVRVRGKGSVEKNPFTNEINSSPRYGKMCGIPQGSPISACLSNIYMMEFDVSLKKLASQLDGKYYRYCDDILFICDIEKMEFVKRFIEEEILKSHLKINDKKTEITYFKRNVNGQLRGIDERGNYQNLQYLGFEFNGQNIYIRSSSMSRYYRRMTARIRENLKAAYGKKGRGNNIFKKKLYNRYTEKGERNFISYAERASNHMNSATIYKQYKNSIIKVKKRLSEKKQKIEDKRGIVNIKF